MFQLSYQENVVPGPLEIGRQKLDYGDISDKIEQRKGNGHIVFPLQYFLLQHCPLFAILFGRHSVLPRDLFMHGDASAEGTSPGMATQLFETYHLD